MTITFDNEYVLFIYLRSTVSVTSVVMVRNFKCI
jgi:hypothetical protein